MTVFHIHVDAAELSKDFDAFLVDTFGFWRMDFEGGPENAETYEPANHLTLKPTTPERFKDAFDRIVEFAEANKAMIGYIEGEIVPLDRDSAPRAYNPPVPIPFRVRLESLPRGTFRETEVHITLNRDK